MTALQPSDSVTTATVPREVSLAVFLFLGSLLLGLLSLPFTIFDEQLREESGFLVFLGVLWVVLVSLWLFLILKIRRRANWARWVVGIVVVLSFVSTLHSFGEHWQESPVTAVLDLLAELMDIVAVGLLFARHANDWFAHQSDLSVSPALAEQPAENAANVTSMGYVCPHCRSRIAFLSGCVQRWGKEQACPYCHRRIRRDVAYGQFFLLMLLLGVPVKLLGKLFPSLSVLGGPLMTGLLMGFLFMLCTRFKRAEA